MIETIAKEVDAMTKNLFKDMAPESLARQLRRHVWADMEAGSVRSDLVEEVIKRLERENPCTEIESREVECRNTDCEERARCHHAEPHHPDDECLFVCDAEEPCTRCYPVAATENTTE